MFAIYTCEEFNIPRSRGPLLSESNPSQKKKNSHDHNIITQHLKKYYYLSKMYVFVQNLLPNFTSEAKLNGITVAALPLFRVSVMLHLLCAHG